MADLSPASISNIPSPNEKFSLADEPVILKSMAISSGAILDKCTFIFREEAVLGPLEFIVQNSTIGSSIKLSSSGSSIKLLSSSFAPLVLIASIILLSKLTLKPCRDEVVIRLEIAFIFWSTQRVAIRFIAFALSITGCFKVGSVNSIRVLKLNSVMSLMPLKELPKTSSNAVFSIKT